MEDYNKRDEGQEREIIFSRTIKAGKRIYYVDVKRNRRDDLYLAITESKKIANGEGDDVHYSYEKHKLFLYKEDFAKFQESLAEAIAFVEENQGKAEPREEVGGDIKLDIDF